MMAFVPAAEHSHRCRSGRAVITSCLGCDLKMKCACVCVCCTLALFQCITLHQACIMINGCCVAVKAEVSLWSASGKKLISVLLPGPTDFTLG